MKDYTRIITIFAVVALFIKLSVNMHTVAKPTDDWNEFINSEPVCIETLDNLQYGRLYQMDDLQFTVSMYGITYKLPNIDWHLQQTANIKESKLVITSIQRTYYVDHSVLIPS